MHYFNFDLSVGIVVTALHKYQTINLLTAKLHNHTNCAHCIPFYIYVLRWNESNMVIVGVAVTDIFIRAWIVIFLHVVCLLVTVQESIYARSVINVPSAWLHRVNWIDFIWQIGGFRWKIILETYLKYYQDSPFSKVNCANYLLEEAWRLFKNKKYIILTSISYNMQLSWNWCYYHNNSVTIWVACRMTRPPV